MLHMLPNNDIHDFSLCTSNMRYKRSPLCQRAWLTFYTVIIDAAQDHPFHNDGPIPVYQIAYTAMIQFMLF